MSVARWPLLSGLAAFALAAAALTACNLGRDTGYVEIRTIPATVPVQAALYLNAQKLDSLRKGTAVLREGVGTHKLGIEAFGAPMPLCELVVKKNRITTVTVSLLDRPPRCQCRNSAATDAAANRTCLG